MAKVFRMAARNLLRHLSRTLFSLAAIVAGVLGLALAGGFIEDVYHQLAERTIHAQLGHLQLMPKGMRAQGGARPEAYLMTVPRALEQTISGHPQVRQTLKRLRFSALVAFEQADFAVDVEGVEPAREAALGLHLSHVAGQPLHQSTAAAGIVVGEGVARRLGLRPGDLVQVAGSTLDGAMNSLEFTVSGIFRSFSKDYDDRTVRIALPLAQELLQTDKISSVVVELNETGQTDAVLRALVPATAAAGFEIRPWHELSDFYGSVRAMYERQFGMLQGVAMVLVLMSVVNSLNMTIFERTAEFGTMRALGDRQSSVIALVMAEATLLGLVGALLGGVLALALANLLSAIGIPMPPPPNAEEGYLASIALTVPVLAISMAVGLFAAVLAGVRPALRIARIPIVDALRASV